MTKAAVKITLSPSRDIPFDRLTLSPSNVRHVRSAVSVEELAEDIARRGLLQSLSVRPVLDVSGAATGMFEVLAGGRRFQALSILVKQKRLAKTAPIPCVVREPGSAILAEDDSLAENVQRLALHPLDQFRAFVALHDKGQGDEDIAAAFFVTPQLVRQRRKLAAVAPALLEIFAEDGITLDQLMAFTVNPDHDRQVQVWDSVKSSWNKEAPAIRRLLTEKTVRASDRRAVFIGLDAYEAAGGTILRDLFAGDDGGWLEDAGLLDRLVAAKLKAAAESVAAEGWKWIEVAAELPYDFSYRLRQIPGTPAPLSAEEAAAHAAQIAEFDALEAEYSGADEYPDEIDARLGALESAIEAVAERPRIFDPAEVARAGAFVTLGRDGRLAIERGHVRPEDEAAAQDDSAGDAGTDGQGTGDRTSAHPPGTVITHGGEPAEIVAEDEEEDGLKPLSERLVMELTAHRTLALREAVGRSPEVALTLLLHKLVTDVFGRFGASGGCLEASVRQVHMPVQAPSLRYSPVAKAVEDRHAAWAVTLPADDDAALWDHLAALDPARRLGLLAHCLSFGVTALHEKTNPYGAGLSASGLTRRMALADIMAGAVSLDMVAAGWEPTAEAYLSRVPKARILEAVREAKGEGTARLLDPLKKAEMATEAERLLKGSGWLPEVLRRADATAFEAEAGADGQGAAPKDEDAGADELVDLDLPAFLLAELPEAAAPVPAQG